MSGAQVCYLMQQNGHGHLVKIGITSDVERRAKQICAGTPFSVTLMAIIGGGGATEREFKVEFKALHVKGEWFHPDTSINDWLAAKFASGQMLKQIKPDQAFILANLAPLALSYLAGRDPANNNYGDLVARLLAGKLPDSASRSRELAHATKGTITAEIAHGYVPNFEEGAYSTICLPASLSVVGARA